jgi:hypothetical protein
MGRAKNEELLEAHVAFEMERFADGRLRETLREELGALHDRVRGVPVRDLVARRAVVEVIRTRLLEPEPTEEGRAFAVLLLKKTRTLLSSTHSTVGELVPPVVLEPLIKEAIAADKVRRALVHELVRSPIYTRIISEVLFDGIKAFMEAGNVAKNLPGAQALLSLGQNLVSGVAPGIEKTFEAGIKDFIATHSHEILKGSEETIVESMKPELLREAITDAYEQIAGRQISELESAMPDSDPSGMVGALEEVWKSVRRPLLENVATLWVDTFLNQYGYKTVGDLFDQTGLDRDAFLSEGDLLLGPALRRAREDGYLEDRIRARLSAFYQSDAARKIIG